VSDTGESEGEGEALLDRENVQEQQQQQQQQPAPKGAPVPSQDLNESPPIQKAQLENRKGDNWGFRVKKSLF